MTAMPPYCSAADCHNPHTAWYWTTGAGYGPLVYAASFWPSYGGARLCKAHAMLRYGWCIG